MKRVINFAFFNSWDFWNWFVSFFFFSKRALERTRRVTAFFQIIKNKLTTRLPNGVSKGADVATGIIGRLCIDLSTSPRMLSLGLLFPSFLFHILFFCLDRNNELIELTTACLLGRHHFVCFKRYLVWTMCTLFFSLHFRHRLCTDSGADLPLSAQLAVMSLDSLHFVAVRLFLFFFVLFFFLFSFFFVGGGGYFLLSVTLNVLMESVTVAWLM